MHAFYKELIRLRKLHPAFRPEAARHKVNVHRGDLVEIVLETSKCRIAAVFNFSSEAREYRPPENGFELLLDSSDSCWVENGPLGTRHWVSSAPPHSCGVFGLCMHSLGAWKLNVPSSGQRLDSAILANIR